MTADVTARRSPRLRARIAGVFYLITVATGIFAEATRGKVIVSGDASATAHNILASETLYRLAFAADIVAGAAYVVVTLLLYVLLKPVSRNLSLLAAFFSLVGVAVGAVSAIGHIAPLILLGGAHYLATFDNGQLQTMALVCLKLHALGANVGLVFFGFYCLLLGYLIFESSFFPRTLGVLVAIGGACLIAHGFVTFVSPPLATAVSDYLLGLDGLGEISLTLWLLFVGVNATKWEEKARSEMPFRARLAPTL